MCARSYGETIHLTKRQRIKKIMQTIKSEQPLSKHKIELIIQKQTLALDPRTLSKWFNLLWALEYLEQPHRDKYIVSKSYNE